MGPHFFKCGNSGKQVIICFPAKSFNGAALFQVRKLDDAYQEAISGAQLQWGRTFSSAETFGGERIPTLATPSFNGAALFQVRKLDKNIIDIMKNIRLQWGRTFSSAETLETMERLDLTIEASMGPHFFKCGNLLRQISTKT